MKKLWVKYYLVLGSVLMGLLIAVGSVAFVSKNISQAESKQTFESIYLDTKVDFIIPSPSQEQVAELEKETSAGIEAVTPYYATSSSVIINGNAVNKGSVVIFPDADKLEYTPYNEERIVSGGFISSGGSAIIDTVYANNTGAKVGDQIEISMAGSTMQFTIVGVSESNTYFKEGSVALVLTTDQASILKDAGAIYGAAYVSATDLNKCKNYLVNEYKPLGRLKDKAEFSSEDTYNEHLKNFEAADWTQEITDCAANYNSLSVKYANVTSSIIVASTIYAVLIAALVIVFNNILLRHESIRQFMRAFLIKNGGTKAVIATFYTDGIACNLVFFVIADIAIYILLQTRTTLSLISLTLVSAALPVMAAIVASLIMCMVAKSYVQNSYTIPKKKTENDGTDGEDAESATDDSEEDSPNSMVTVMQDNSSVDK